MSSKPTYSPLFQKVFGHAPIAILFFISTASAPVSAGRDEYNTTLLKKITCAGLPIVAVLGLGFYFLGCCETTNTKIAATNANPEPILKPNKKAFSLREFSKLRAGCLIPGVICLYTAYGAYIETGWKWNQKTAYKYAKGAGIGLLAGGATHGALSIAPEVRNSLVGSLTGIEDPGIITTGMLGAWLALGCLALKGHWNRPSMHRRTILALQKYSWNWKKGRPSMHRPILAAVVVLGIIIGTLHLKRRNRYRRSYLA